MTFSVPVWKPGPPKVVVTNDETSKEALSQVLQTPVPIITTYIEFLPQRSLQSSIMICYIYLELHSLHSDFLSVLWSDLCNNPVKQVD